MGTGPTLTFFGPLGNAGGATVVVPTPREDGRGAITSIGVDLGVGYLATRAIEPGIFLDFELTHYSAAIYGTSQTYGVVSLAPFVKFNTWVRERFNPFVEAHAGLFELVNDAGHAAALQSGISTGLEWLFGGTWGLRVWAGIVLLYHDSAMYEIPLRWGFTGYL